MLTFVAIALIFVSSLLLYMYSKKVYFAISRLLLIYRLDRNIDYLFTFIDDLDFKYGSFKVKDSPYLFNDLSLLDDKKKLDKYTIKKTYRIDSNRHLCVTKCVNEETGVTLKGRTYDRKRTYQIVFLIVKNPTNLEYEFYSDVYYTLLDKNIKNTFSIELEKYFVSKK